MSAGSYLLYILKCKDGSLYTGITNALENRLNTHKKGRGSKYVAARLPFECVYCEGPFSTKSEAMKREFAVKKLTREQKIELIRSSLSREKRASL